MATRAPVFDAPAQRRLVEAHDAELAGQRHDALHAQFGGFLHDEIHAFAARHALQQRDVER